MKDDLRKTLEVLREKVKQNLEIIHGNEADVRKLLKDEPVSSMRSDKLSIKFNINKKMLEENHESINLQLSIIKFMEKVQPVTVSEPVENEDPNYCFELTVTGNMAYNEKHPYFNDDAFFCRLMDYYMAKEDYEKCANLQNTRKTKV